MKIREALRMREEGFNNSQIARSVTVNLARSIVVELFRRCDAHTISYDMAQSMSDTDLEILLYPHKHKPTKSRAALEETVWLDYMATHGVDRQEAWEAYVQMEPDAVSYPQFCRRLRDYQKLHAPALDYPKRRMPGEIVFVNRKRVHLIGRKRVHSVGWSYYKSFLISPRLSIALNF